jgi:hypothetical protein
MCGGSGLNTHIQEGQNGHLGEEKNEVLQFGFFALNTLRNLVKNLNTDSCSVILDPQRW